MAQAAHEEKVNDLKNSFGNFGLDSVRYYSRYLDKYGITFEPSAQSSKLTGINMLEEILALGDSIDFVSEDKIQTLKTVADF